MSTWPPFIRPRGPGCEGSSPGACPWPGSASTTRWPRRQSRQGLTREARLVIGAGHETTVAEAMRPRLPRCTLRTPVMEGETEGMASDVMTLEAPPTVSASEPLATAVQRMVDDRVEFFVVVDGSPSRPVGLLSHAELR